MCRQHGSIECCACDPAEHGHKCGCKGHFIHSCPFGATHSGAGDTLHHVLQGWSSSAAWCQEEDLYLDCCRQRAQGVCSMLFDVPVVLQQTAV